MLDLDPIESPLLTAAIVETADGFRKDQHPGSTRALTAYLLAAVICVGCAGFLWLCMVDWRVERLPWWASTAAEKREHETQRELELMMESVRNMLKQIEGLEVPPTDRPDKGSSTI